MPKDIKSSSELEPGSVIRNKGSKQVYVVIENTGNHVTAVRSVDVSNLPEWEIVMKPEFVMNEAIGVKFYEPKNHDFSYPIIEVDE